MLSLLSHSAPAHYNFLLIGPVSPTLSAQAEALGATVIQWKPKHVADIASLFALWRLLRLHKVDLVHFHCPRAAFMARALTHLLGLPTVVTVHLPPYYFTSAGYMSSRFGRWFYLKCERLLNSRFTDQLIYASSRVMAEAQALGLTRADRTISIPNGIDLARYRDRSKRQSLRAEFGVGADETLLCCVGRLEQQKGVEVLLKAFSQLDLKTLKGRLWLVGDGSLRPALEEMARHAGIEDSVQFLGFRSDVNHLLAAADIFVLASFYEAMPLAILEALASGLPCIVSDTGENALLVKDMVNGLLVPPGDIGALAQALERLLSAPELCRRLGEASGREAEHYNAAETAKRIQQIYTRLAP